MKPPQGKAAGHPQGPGRRPEYVIVTWVSAQLRDKIQRNGASLAEALQATGRNAPGLADPGLEDREAGQAVARPGMAGQCRAADMSVQTGPAARARPAPALNGPVPPQG